jgi:hypothetical protein
VFDDLGDPHPPEPGPSALEAVLARAAHLRRRRRLLATGGSVGAVVALVLTVALVAASGDGGRGQDVTAAGGGLGRSAPTATSTSSPPGDPGASPVGGSGTSSTSSAPAPTSLPPTVSPTPRPEKSPPPTPSTTTPSRPSNDTTSGAEGRVLVGPTCPVESVDHPCPDRPAEGVEVWATRHGDTETVATTTTTSDGSFHLNLPPGTYDLYARAGMSCDPQTVTVESGRVSQADISCDSGIR